MPEGTELTTVGEVRKQGSVLFTATNSFDMAEEVILVPCESDASVDAPVRAWINRCTHESQRFDRGQGVAMRDGELICLKHGSMFDACSGDCDNGMAAGTTLPDVDVTVDDGTVYLTDKGYAFDHLGGLDDSSGGPSSTSHVGF